DVDPRPKKDPEKMHEFLKNVAELVEKRGAGLLLIAGERYMPRAYRDTPLKDVMPIELVGDAKDEADRTLTRGYRPELTPLGLAHPIFRLDPNEKKSQEIWSNLRELYWHPEAYRAKRAAEVLAVHPEVKAEGGKGNLPLVVQQFVGAGRSMFFGFNETW